MLDKEAAAVAAVAVADPAVHMVTTARQPEPPQQKPVQPRRHSGKTKAKTNKTRLAGRTTGGMETAASSGLNAPIRRLTPSDKHVLSTPKWTTLSPFGLEDPVSVADKNSAALQGVVVYVGQVHFASGIWVGIQLTGPSIGKGYNDGSVERKRYFPNVGKKNGVFARVEDVQRRIKTSMGNSSVPTRQQQQRKTTRAVLADLNFVETLKDERAIAILKRNEERRRLLKFNSEEIYIQRLKQARLDELRTSRNEPLQPSNVGKNAAMPKFGTTKPLEQHDFDFVKSLEMTQQSYCVSDPTLPDNPIVFASQSFLNMTGYSQSGIIGRNCRFLQGRQTDPRSIDRLRIALKEGSDCTICVLNYRRDGSTFFNHCSVTALRDERGRIKFYLGVSTEVPADYAVEFNRCETNRLQAESHRARMRNVERDSNAAPGSGSLPVSQNNLKYGAGDLEDEANTSPELTVHTESTHHWSQDGSEKTEPVTPLSTHSDSKSLQKVLSPGYVLGPESVVGLPPVGLFGAEPSIHGSDDGSGHVRSIPLPPVERSSSYHRHRTVGMEDPSSDIGNWTILPPSHLSDGPPDDGSGSFHAVFPPSSRSNSGHQRRQPEPESAFQARLPNRRAGGSMSDHQRRQQLAANLSQRQLESFISPRYLKPAPTVGELQASLSQRQLEAFMSPRHLQSTPSQRGLAANLSQRHLQPYVQANGDGDSGSVSTMPEMIPFLPFQQLPHPMVPFPPQPMQPMPPLHPMQPLQPVQQLPSQAPLSQTSPALNRRGKARQKNLPVRFADNPYLPKGLLPLQSPKAQKQSLKLPERTDDTQTPGKKESNTSDNGKGKDNNNKSNSNNDNDNSITSKTKQTTVTTAVGGSLGTPQVPPTPGTPVGSEVGTPKVPVIPKETNTSLFVPIQEEEQTEVGNETVAEEDGIEQAGAPPKRSFSMQTGKRKSDGFVPVVRVYEDSIGATQMEVAEPKQRRKPAERRKSNKKKGDRTKKGSWYRLNAP